MTGEQRLNAQETRPKRDAAATRERILKAATNLFSRRGYAATGIRDIAEGANVSLPLLSRYFGSKAGLFEAVLRNSLERRPFLNVPKSEFGLNLANLILGTDPAELSIAIMVLAAADPEAQQIATRVVEEQVIVPLAEWIGGHAAHRRAVAIAMMGSGFVTHLHLLPVIGKPAAIVMDDGIVRWFAASCQHIIDADDDW